MRHKNGYLDAEHEEQALLAIDDTWLKLAQVMWTRDRKAGKTRRKSDYENRSAAEWASKAMEDVRKRK